MLLYTERLGKQSKLNNGYLFYHLPLYFFKGISSCGFLSEFTVGTRLALQKNVVHSSKELKGMFEAQVNILW